MKKFVMIIDVAKCNNCNACVVSVKDEYVGNDFSGYSAAQPKLGHTWLRVDRLSRGSGTMVDFTYVPTMCNHCENAPCVKAAGDGSVYQRSDGIVIMDPVKTKGRSDIVKSCPYGMISWNDEKEIPQTWIFDAHLIDSGWDKPRCVNSCPSGCFEVRQVTDEEFAALETSPAYSPRNERLRATRPRILYKNFDKAKTAFVGGNVTTTRDSRKFNVEGAVVSLHKDNNQIKEARTDIFGDFRFDSLPYNSGKYTVAIVDSGRKPVFSKHIDVAADCVVMDEISI